MSESEKLHELIAEIAVKKKIGMFEAVILFSSENNIDIEDIVKVLDDTIKEKLKQDALKMGIVCNRKLFEPSIKTTSLF